MYHRKAWLAKIPFDIGGGIHFQTCLNELPTKYHSNRNKQMSGTALS